MSKENDLAIKVARELAQALRAQHRWQLEYGGEGYYDGAFASMLFQETEKALGEWDSLLAAIAKASKERS